MDDLKYCKQQSEDIVPEVVPVMDWSYCLLFEKCDNNNSQFNS